MDTPPHKMPSNTGEGASHPGIREAIWDRRPDDRHRFNDQHCLAFAGQLRSLGGKLGWGAPRAPQPFQGAGGWGLAGGRGFKNTIIKMISQPGTTALWEGRLEQTPQVGGSIGLGPLRPNGAILGAMLGHPTNRPAGLPGFEWEVSSQASQGSWTCPLPLPEKVLAGEPNIWTGDGRTRWVRGWWPHPRLRPAETAQHSPCCPSAQ